MKTLTDAIVNQIKTELPTKEYTVPENLCTTKGDSIGWGVTTKDGAPKFTANDFFVAPVSTVDGEDDQLRLFVRHSSKAGKVTVWEHVHTDSDLEMLQSFALDCLIPNRQVDNTGTPIPWAFFRTLTNEGERLWTVNQALIPSESQLRKLHLPAAIVTAQINRGLKRVQAYCEAHGVFSIEDASELNLPPIPSAYPLAPAAPAASKEVA